MDSYDPFKRYVGTPEGPASTIFAITPSDEHDLVRGVKRIRVFNSANEIAFIAVVGLGDDATPAILPIPPLSLLWEDIRIKKLLATGTTPGLTIHGMSD